MELLRYRVIRRGTYLPTLPTQCDTMPGRFEAWGPWAFLLYLYLCSTSLSPYLSAFSVSSQAVYVTTSGLRPIGCSRILVGKRHWITSTRKLTKIAILCI